MPEREFSLECTDCRKPFSGKIKYKNTKGGTQIEMQGELLRQLAEHHYHAVLSAHGNFVLLTEGYETGFLMITRKDLKARPHELEKWYARFYESL